MELNNKDLISINDISPEEIRENWSGITSLDNPKSLNNIAESFGYISSILV